MKQRWGGPYQARDTLWWRDTCTQKSEDEVVRAFLWESRRSKTYYPPLLFSLSFLCSFFLAPSLSLPPPLKSRKWWWMCMIWRLLWWWVCSSWLWLLVCYPSLFQNMLKIQLLYSLLWTVSLEVLFLVCLIILFYSLHAFFFFFLGFTRIVFIYSLLSLTLLHIHLEFYNIFLTPLLLIGAALSHMMPSAAQNFVEYFADKDSFLKEYPPRYKRSILVKFNLYLTYFIYPFTPAIAAFGLLLLLTIDRTLLCMSIIIYSFISLMIF